MNSLALKLAIRYHKFDLKFSIVVYIFCSRDETFQFRFISDVMLFHQRQLHNVFVKQEGKYLLVQFNVLQLVGKFIRPR